MARKTASALQDLGIRAMYDVNGRSLKAQFKYAGKLNAEYVMTIGEEEAKAGRAMLKRMADGSETPADIDPGRLAAALR